jgi:signal transduction histidine kinase
MWILSNRRTIVYTILIPLFAVSVVPLVFGIQLSVSTHSILKIVIGVFALAMFIGQFFIKFGDIRISSYFASSVFLFSIVSNSLTVFPTNIGHLQEYLGGVTLLLVGIFLVTIRPEFSKRGSPAKHWILSIFVTAVMIFAMILNIITNPTSIIETVSENLLFIFIIICCLNLLLLKPLTEYLRLCVILIMSACTIDYVIQAFFFIGVPHQLIQTAWVQRNTDLALFMTIAIGFSFYSLHLMGLVSKETEQLKKTVVSGTYRKLLDVVNEGLLSIDPVKMRITECTDWVAKLLKLGDDSAIDLNNKTMEPLYDIVIETLHKTGISTRKMPIGQYKYELKAVKSVLTNHPKVLVLIRDVTELEQQIEQESKRSRILEMLVDIANASNRLENLKQTCNYTISAILDLIDFEYGVIFIHDFKANTTEMISPVGFSSLEPLDMQRMSTKISNSLAMKAMLSRQEIKIDESSDQYSLSDYPMLKMLSLKSLIITPFQVNPDRTGCLFVGTAKSRIINIDELQLARTVSTQIGSTIDRYLLLESLNEKYKQLQVSDKMKDELITMIGHELRTPLTSIVGFVELLDMDHDGMSQNQKEFISILHHQTDILSWLVSEINLLAVLKNGRYYLEIEPVNISQVLSSLEGRFSPETGTGTVKISLGLKGISEFMTDKNAFISICSNLLLAFQRLAFGDSSIELGIHNTDKSIIIEVSDNSTPLGKDDIANIFEMFSTISTKPSTINKGTIGLPLSIVKEFVNLLGGSMWFDTGDTGNKAVVELPVTRNSHNHGNGNTSVKKSPDTA